jgi:GntR family transcriptional regulator, transcriptional repressor for pyruvate dehydrogenase complex
MPINELVRWQPVEKTRSYAQIVTQIEDMIRSGHLKIGDKMPSERSLAEQFQVSRVVVREGIRHLEARKIIEVLQGSGTYVRRIPPQTLAQNVTFLLELEKSSFVDLMVVRQALEVTAARLAATQATQDDLSEIAACTLAMREISERSGNEKDKYFDYGAKDLDLHRVIARASHNAPLATFLESILPMIMEGRFALVNSFGDAENFFRRRGVERIHTEHVGIIDALRRHDADAAARLMTQHTARSIAFFKNIEDLYRAGDPRPADIE